MFLNEQSEPTEGGGMNAPQDIMYAVRTAVDELNEEVPGISFTPIELGLSSQPKDWTEDEYPLVLNALAGVLGFSTAEIEGLTVGERLTSPRHPHIELGFMVGYAGKPRTYRLIYHSVPDAA